MLKCKILGSEKMPEVWRSVRIQVLKKRVMCTAVVTIETKLRSHSMLQGRVVEARLRGKLQFYT